MAALPGLDAATKEAQQAADRATAAAASKAAPPVRLWMDLQTILNEIEEEMKLEQASTVQLHVQLFSKVCDQFLLSATTVMYTAITFYFGL
jgi:hypothetical protein